MTSLDVCVSVCGGICLRACLTRFSDKTNKKNREKNGNKNNKRKFCVSVRIAYRVCIQLTTNQYTNWQLFSLLYHILTTASSSSSSLSSLNLFFFVGWSKTERAEKAAKFQAKEVFSFLSFNIVSYCRVKLFLFGWPYEIKRKVFLNPSIFECIKQIILTESSLNNSKKIAIYLN